MLSTSTSLFVGMFHTLAASDDSDTKRGGSLVADVLWYLQTMLIHIDSIVQISRRVADLHANASFY